MDKLTPQKRSENMGKIRSVNTKPELLVRKYLYSKGFRYRLHSCELPGKPDIVLPKYKAVVQINGCFWHNHECKFMRIPLSNSDYWENKLKRNCDRDTHNNNLLEELGWRILIVWECAIKYASKDSLQKTLEGIESWINSDSKRGDITSTNEGGLKLISPYEYKTSVRTSHL